MKEKFKDSVRSLFFFFGVLLCVSCFRFFLRCERLERFVFSYFFFIQAKESGKGGMF